LEQFEILEKQFYRAGPLEQYQAAALTRPGCIQTD
jgi:hypothetical protein